MKTNRLFSKMIAVFLLLSLLVPVFSGCNAPKEYKEVPASQVEYNEEGNYVSTLYGIQEDVELKDVQIRYSAFDREGYFARKKADKEGKISTADFTFRKEATVKSITRDGEKLTVSFRDENAENFRTLGYSIYVKPEGKVGAAELVYPEFTLLPLEKELSASKKNPKITFELQNGRFEEGLTPGDITLSGAFREMQVERVTAAGKTVTLELKGKILKHGPSNAYTDGVAEFKRVCFKNGVSSVKAKVQIVPEALYFDMERLDFHDGNATLPLVTEGIFLPEELKKTDFRLPEGVELLGTVNGDGEVFLLLEIPGATDKNACAKMLDGKEIRVKDKTFIASLPEASFYPVFDFAEKQGDFFRFILSLHGIAGEFGDICKENFTFSGDLAGSQVEDFRLLTDEILEVRFLVPGRGQSESDFAFEGGVQLDEGCLLNAWGSPASSFAFTRLYSDDTLGKAWEDIDFDAIFEFIGGIGNTKFGTLLNVASGGLQILQAYTTIRQILEIAGVVETEEGKSLKEIKELQEKTVEMLKEHTAMLKELKLNLDLSRISAFDTKVMTLRSQSEILEGYFTLGQKLLGEPVPDKDKTSSKDLADYNKRLVERIRKEEKEGNLDFLNFTRKAMTVEDLFIEVCAELEKTDANNPVSIFDQICVQSYNFDTGAYRARMLYRSDITGTLSTCFARLLLYYDFVNHPENPDCNVLKKHYGEAKRRIDVISENMPTTADYDAFLYVKNESVCKFMDPGFAYRGEESEERYAAFCESDENFSDEEMQLFIKRMHAGDIYAELNLAGFTDYGNNKALGEECGNIPVVFSCKVEKGKWSRDLEDYTYTVTATYLTRNTQTFASQKVFDTNLWCGDEDPGIYLYFWSR